MPVKKKIKTISILFIIFICIFLLAQGEVDQYDFTEIEDVLPMEGITIKKIAPDASVDIIIVNKKAEYYSGEIITMRAVIKGIPEDAKYTIDWYEIKPNETVNLNCHSLEYAMPITEEKLDYFYRVIVTIE